MRTPNAHAHAGRIHLERIDRHFFRREEGLDLLPLHGDSIPAVDRAGRLREEAEVEGASSSANRATAAMEKAQAHTGGAADVEQILHRHVQLPERRELAGVL